MSETVQNDNAFTYGIKYNSKGYISQTKTAEGIRWTEEKKLQSLETLNSWFLTLEQDSFVFKDEYISCEENDEGVVFTYDRSQEIKPSENEINAVKETYYFDKKWNLIKVELISEGMMSYENGQSGKLEILITTEFIGSSKKDITKKLEDVIKKVK